MLLLKWDIVAGVMSSVDIVRTIKGQMSPAQLFKNVSKTAASVAGSIVGLVVLDVKDLAASYRKNTVLHHVNFEVEAGTLTGIVGPNGAGKTLTPNPYRNCHFRLSEKRPLFT